MKPFYTRRELARAASSLAIAALFVGGLIALGGYLFHGWSPGHALLYLWPLGFVFVGIFLVLIAALVYDVHSILLNRWSAEETLKEFSLYMDEGATKKYSAEQKIFFVYPLCLVVAVFIILAAMAGKGS